MKYTVVRYGPITCDDLWALVREGNGVCWSGTDKEFLEHMAESLNHAVERLENEKEKEVWAAIAKDARETMWKAEVKLEEEAGVQPNQKQSN